MRSLLFIARSLDAVFETWMMRMLEFLEPHVSLIVVRNARGRWRGIDTFPLIRNDLRSRMLRKLRGHDSTLERLSDTIRHRRIGQILINYATMALETRPAWENLDVDVFVHCHGWDIHFDARSESWPHQNLHSAEYRAAIREMSQRVIYIANSQHTKRALVEQGISESRIRVKLFGAEDRGDLPIARKTPAGPLRLLFLGRLIDCKGPDLVIRAFDLACQKGLSAELTIAGDGHLLNCCELLRHESPFRERIVILGPVDRQEAARLYREADVFVCHHRRGPITNREEAFGVTMIEAMSYGLPVLTGRSGGVVESVVHGETGYLVEPGDLSSYVEYLLRLDRDAGERRRLGTNGIRRVREHFSLGQEEQALIGILGL